MQRWLLCQRSSRARESVPSLFWSSGLRLTLPKRHKERKLRQLDSATELRDLASPPGNHLEALRRDRHGQHSIRINDQLRICFVWSGGDALNVEIVDYH
jgi:toxin HigB-1